MALEDRDERQAFANPAVKEKIAQLGEEIKRLRVYEAQCNDLAHKFCAPLISDAVPKAIEYIEHLLKEFERMQLMADEQRKRAILAEDAARSLQGECEKMSAGCCEHLVGDPFGNGTCKYRERFSNLKSLLAERDRQIEILTERADRGCHSGCLEHPEGILSTSHHPDCKKEELHQTKNKLKELEEECAELRLYKNLVSKDWDWKRVQHCEEMMNAALARAETAETALKDARWGSDDPLVRERLRKIGHEIRTQDNLATENPIFMVQQRRRLYGMSWEYTDNCTWVHEDGGEEIDEDGRVELEESWQTNGCTYIDGCHRVGYVDIWENVQPFFTRKGAEEYLRVNGHNLRPETRIFVESGWRNREWADIRATLAPEES